MNISLNYGVFPNSKNIRIQGHAIFHELKEILYGKETGKV